MTVQGNGAVVSPSAWAAVMVIIDADGVRHLLMRLINDSKCQRCSV